MVNTINSDLSIGADLTAARPLAEQRGVAFIGDVKAGKFEVPPKTAEAWLSAPNPHGKSNSDVLKPWVNASDIVTHRRRGYWIIDFPADMTEYDAALYELPFRYVLENVKPARDRRGYDRYSSRWWIHDRQCIGFRKATEQLHRFIVTPRVSKYRLFVWLSVGPLPDNALVVFARDDDYFFGVLHSKAHELWARGTGTQLRDVESGFRYSPTLTFETFPFPRPAKEQESAIAAAARELNELRENWLNPPPDPKTGEPIAEIELKKRTLTNLYNARPTWLDNAHRKLDRAVFDAYGWPHDIADEQILERLLSLNLEREAVQGGSGFPRSRE